MSADADRLPVALVTGFLGSGKTTLINALLRLPAFADSVVVVNEFGAVGLDHLLVTESRDNVVLLDSGCLCCAAEGSLRDTLIDLFMRRRAGTLPPFRRVIVETSGLANPAPLFACLLADSAVSAHFRLGLTLCMADAVHGESTLEAYAEAQRQVALADRLVLSKTDMATAQAAASLRAVLASLNPRAALDVWTPGQDAAHLFDEVPQSGSPRYSPVAGPHHGRRFAAIGAVELEVGTVPDWQAYAAWSAQMRERFGARLLRCKGIVAIESPGRPWVVQCVQGHFSPPQRLKAWPEGVTRGFLVCIGEGIAEAELHDVLPLLQGAGDAPSHPRAAAPGLPRMRTE